MARVLRPSPAFVAALLLAGCGGDGDAASSGFSNQWLLLRLAADAAAVPEPVVVASHDLLAERAAWLIEAPEVTDRLPPGAPDVPGAPDGPSDEAHRTLQLRATRTDELVRLTRPGALDTGSFNSVELSVAFNGHGAVRLEFGRGGESVAQTDATMLRAGKDPVRVAVNVPAEVAAFGPFDSLALRFDGDARTIGLRRVELLSRPPASLLPDPAAPPELVKLGDEARRGVGLAAGRDVQADFAVPDGARLAFSCCQPPSTRRLGKDARLVVDVTDEHGASVDGEQIFESGADEPSRWHTVVVDLSPLAGRATARFRFETADGSPGACALAEVALVAPGPAAPPRPNVLLITSDTHRGDHLGTAGRGVVLATPVLDALAAAGALFEDCFTPINVTNPSHVALMTGRHPRDVGILDNVGALGPAAPTLAEHFRDAGYLTWAAVSTEHLGPAGSGLGQGFDRVSWPPHTPRRAGAAVSDVERWLPDQGGRPLFLWLHVFDAHWPYAPPADWDRRYYPADKDPFGAALPPLDLPAGLMPRDLVGLRDVEYPRAQYRAEVSSLDHELQRVLGADDLAGAIVAFVADHGESLGEHGIWFNHDGLYPEVLHVPLILRWPGGPAGARVTGPVSHLDVGRTLLDLAGLARVEFPGRSLADLAPAGGNAGSPAPRFALALNGLSASVTDGGLHLIVHLQGHRTPRMQFAAARHQTELYDLSADPGCTRDLLGERLPAARALRGHLIEWLGATEDLGWVGERSADPDSLAALSQLGYTGGDSAPRAGPLWLPDDCDWCRRLR